MTRRWRRSRMTKQNPNADDTRHKGREPVDILKLKNGAEEAASLVKVTMMSVKRLMESNPIALIELALLCRDRDHELFGNTAVELQSLGLVDPGGSVHGSIRNVILSAVEGEGLKMIFASPLAQVDSEREEIPECKP